jgi:hypothetical protein
MNHLCLKLSDRITTLKRILAAAVCLFSGALISSASVTVQGWWHLDNSQPIADSSGNGRTFGSAYSTDPAAGGEVAAHLINNGAGGPLDSTGWTSSQCILVGTGENGGNRNSAMWDISYNPPAENFGIEIWVFPQGAGVNGGSAWIFSTGESGGVALQITAPSGAPSYINAFDLGTGDTIGDQALVDTNNWMHIAIVNDGGITTFYTNGVPCGASNTTATTTSAGFVCMLASQSDDSAYKGYADEARMFTFTAGAFSTNDLLLRPPGPNIVSEPQNDVVWNGGAAPFTTIASFDSNLVYQWESDGASIEGATNSTYLLPVVALANSGSNFECVVLDTVSGISVTTAPSAILTVATPNAADVAAYENVVTAEPSLLAYFPVTDCTNLVVTNVVDATHNGALENSALSRSTLTATSRSRTTRLTSSTVASGRLKL